MKVWCLRVVIFSVVMFPAGVSAALLCYPADYSFFNNFLSDLGRTKTVSGIDNFASCLLFNISLSLVMLSLLPFWYFRTAYISWKVLRGFAFVCCSCFSIGMLAVALTPLNLYPKMHNISVYSASIMAVPGMLMLILFSGSGYGGFKYRATWFLSGAFILLCEQVLVIAAPACNIPAVQVHSALQKVNIAIFVIWLFSDLFFFRNILKKEAVRTSDMQTYYIIK